MKVPLLVLLALLAAAAASGFAQRYGGEVIVHSGVWTVRMPLLVALLGLVGAGFGLYLLTEALHRLLRLLPQLRRRRAGRRRRRAAQLYRQAVRETLEHRHDRAQRNLDRVLKLRPESESAHLLAAAVCIELRDWEQWQRHLHAAASAGARPAATLLRLRGLCAMRSWEEAMAIVLERPAAADEPAILAHIRMQCLRAQQNWPQMLAAAQALAPRAGLDRDAIRAWCAEAARGRIAEATPEQLVPLWEEFLEPVRQDPEALRAYARALRRAARRHDALEAHARTRAEREFGAAWLRLYAELPGPARPHLLPQAQRWLRQNPDRPELSHLCAQLHMRAGDWAQARELLERLAPRTGEVRVYRDLARVLTALGEERTALAYYRKELPEIDPDP